MSLEVPSPLNSFDAYLALYNQTNPKHPADPLRLFKFYCPNQICRGPVDVDFSTFPHLNVENYDRQYGEGTAQKALNSYKRASNSQFPSQADLRISPCALFTKQWRRQLVVAGHHQAIEEMGPLVDLCERLEKTETQIFTRLYPPKTAFYPNCQATYSLSERVDSLGLQTDQKQPCKTALAILEILSYSLTFRTAPERLYVERIVTCQYFHPTVPLPFRCETEGPATISAALKMVKEMDQVKR